jgi:hypothetical protein
MRYRFNSKYFRSVPLDTSLLEARNIAVKARAQLVQGVNPADQRRVSKGVTKEGERIFAAVALLIIASD